MTRRWLPLYACHSLHDLDAWIGRDLLHHPRTRAAWGSFHLRHPVWVTDAPPRRLDYPDPDRSLVAAL